MKIELEEPYKSIWKCGYLVINKEDRKHVLLYNTQKDRTTISYARYLLSCNLRRFLLAEEHVDHINNDKTDDRIDNLQVLSQRDNNTKSARGTKMYDFTCSKCGSIFKLRHKNLLGTRKFCSRECYRESFNG